MSKVIDQFKRWESQIIEHYAKKLRRDIDDEDRRRVEQLKQAREAEEKTGKGARFIAFLTRSRIRQRLFRDLADETSHYQVSAGGDRIARQAPAQPRYHL